jgi:hypothetical protein
MAKQKCRVCEVPKYLGQFSKDKKNKSGRRRICKECASSQDRCRKYGLTFKQMFSMIKKQKKCAICEKPLQNFVVDHDHTTGKVRELLCSQCNTGLGLFKENETYLLNAIIYIEKHKE